MHILARRFAKNIVSPEGKILPVQKTGFLLQAVS